jgi:hypothetical protein
MGNCTVAESSTIVSWHKEYYFLANSLITTSIRVPTPEIPSLLSRSAVHLVPQIHTNWYRHSLIASHTAP